MAGRKRVRLVPSDCAEQFEVQIVAYFDREGQTFVAANVSEPGEPNASPPIHEVLGVLDMARDILKAHWEEDDG